MTNHDISLNSADLQPGTQCLAPLLYILGYSSLLKSHSSILICMYLVFPVIPYLSSETFG